MNTFRIASGPSSHLVVTALLCALTSALQAGCDGNGGGTGGGGTGGTGGQDACSAFVTDPPTTAVTVRIVNNTAADLFIGPETPGGCGQIDPFSLDDAGQPVTWQLDSCTFTCEALQKGQCACAADCALPFVWRIAAGGVLEVPWDGIVFPTETMPDTCYDAMCGAGQACFVPREPSGPLTFTATAWTEVSGTCGGGACTCTPDANGTCAISMGEAVVAGTGVFQSTEVDTLGATVDITFE